MTIQWQNWSGSQVHQAQKLALPETEVDIVNLLSKAASEGRSVRTIGSAHSFVPFWTDDYLVSLDNMKGFVNFNQANLQATAKAGTKLHELGEPLWNEGMSMRNMGDIDRQSIAGAISTGTHGTGVTLSNISSQVVGLKMITAAGQVQTLTESDGELFKAAQVSMGTLGLITEVTLQLVPRYFMHEKNWHASVAECEEQREELVSNNRHWEFFWDPHSDGCAMKTLNMTDQEVEASPAEGEEIGRNYTIIPSTRDNKFNEIEFSVPYDAGWECFLEIREMMRQQYPEVRWPVEYRTLAADDLMISSASGRKSVTISAHQGTNYPHEAFFQAVETVFRRYDGRPHWGKVHTHRHEDLSRLYPDWERFRQLRSKQDPDGRFLNTFLNGIFGIS